MKVAAPKFTETEMKAILKSAQEAGMTAANACTPTPMIVQQHANVFDDNSPVVKQWHAPNGVCGFAWVIIKPGTSRFAKFLIKKGIGSKDEYYGGVSVYISQFGQCYEKKCAYAGAFANVLYSHGINANFMSRMD